MDQLKPHRRHDLALAIAASLATCTVAGVAVAILHDGAVVRADQYCRGRVWNDLSLRRREDRRDVIARLCTPAMISALSSRGPASPEEKACDSAYYPQTTDTENGAIMASCHLATRPATENGGVMLLSTRAWRPYAAAIPGPRVRVGDVWLLALGTGPLLVVLAMRRRPA